MIFERNIPGSAEILKDKTVAVAGCGGLGSNISISLARSGVGNLIIADFDVIEASNLNRQQYTQEDLGKLKVEVLAGYLKKINRDINITTIEEKLKPQTMPYHFEAADILIEAFDNAGSKLWLIESWACAYPERAVIVGSGMAGLGGFDKISVKKAGNLYICGDGVSDMSMGLMAPRVAIVANLQAMTALEILLETI
jgi:sulfur carrier protein ThiS adenylyltransferase